MSFISVYIDFPVIVTILNSVDFKLVVMPE